MVYNALVNFSAPHQIVMVEDAKTARVVAFESAHRREVKKYYDIQGNGLFSTGKFLGNRDGRRRALLHEQTESTSEAAIADAESDVQEAERALDESKRQVGAPRAKLKEVMKQLTSNDQIIKQMRQQNKKLQSEVRCTNFFPTTSTLLERA